MAVAQKSFLKKRLSVVSVSGAKEGSMVPSEAGDQSEGDLTRGASPVPGKPSKAASVKSSEDGDKDDDDDDDKDGDRAAMSSGPKRDMATLAKFRMMATQKSPTLMFTFAYWIKWRPNDPIG